MPEVSPAATSPSDPPQDAAATCVGGEGDIRRQQRLAMLRELAGIGMRLARGVERQAEAAEEGAGGDVGLVFARIARAVRQTLALEARLEDELEGRLRQAQATHDRRRAQEAGAPVERRSRLVRRAVGLAIEADADDVDHQDQLFESLDERLCDREHDEDFLDRPMGELVALICKDLGVRVDLRLWEDETWAREEAAERDRPPPSPEAPRELAPAPAPAAEPMPACAAEAAGLAPGGAPSWLSG